MCTVLPVGRRLEDQMDTAAAANASEKVCKNRLLVSKLRATNMTKHTQQVGHWAPLEPRGHQGGTSGEIREINPSHGVPVGVMEVP